MGVVAPLMASKVLDGTALAKRILEDLKGRVAEWRGRGKSIRLVAVYVGDNQVSWIYVNRQREVAESIGIRHDLLVLPGSSTQEEVIRRLEELNHDPSVTGIIVQLPLPSHIHARVVQQHIALEKDVEGIHPANVGRLMYGDPLVVTTTALAAYELFQATGVKLKGLEVVVVGHSEIVGKPLALLLLSSPTESATLTVCHVATKDLTPHTRRADVLFIAVGKPNLITGDMIKEGAVVIDVGINTVPLQDAEGRPMVDAEGRPRRKIVGDVDYEGAKAKCSYISPVPGGVGPLTVAMLMKNTVACAAKQDQA